MKTIKVAIILFCAGGLIPLSNARDYPWLNKFDSSKTIENLIDLPEGYDRIKVRPGSYCEWLRRLPLKDEDSPVYLYNGKKKFNQLAHWEVIDIDVGNKDLQQCADAVIRLRAEYFYSHGFYDSISFNFTSGDEMPYRKWIEGIHPKVKGNKVQWIETGNMDSSYSNFRKYLDVVFTFAGSFSLSKELILKSDICGVEIGDVFIEGGFPGHAVIVVDVAIDKSNGNRIFLLAQSYMPAQDIHILKNPVKFLFNPWYNCDFGETLITPEWIFDKKDLKEF